MASITDFDSVRPGSSPGRVTISGSILGVRSSPWTREAAGATPVYPTNYKNIEPAKIYKINTGSMYHIVYKISNNVNNKIYIGYHSTTNINDNYMGSGKHILNAIKKYGAHNFKKEILYIFPNKEEALLKEAEIVNEEFINRTDTYNLKIGGEGGWDYVNNLIKNDNVFRKNMYLKMQETLKNMHALGILSNVGENNGMYGKSPWNKGISLSIETKNKISQNNGNKLSDELIKNRLIDLMNSELKRGYISQLAKKWNISHTQVKRFINKFGNPE